jgi:hypothetical protein
MDKRMVTEALVAGTCLNQVHAFLVFLFVRRWHLKLLKLFFFPRCLKISKEKSKYCSLSPYWINDAFDFLVGFFGRLLGVVSAPIDFISTTATTSSSSDNQFLCQPSTSSSMATTAAAAGFWLVHVAPIFHLALSTSPCTLVLHEGCVDFWMDM